MRLRLLAITAALAALSAVPAHAAIINTVLTPGENAINDTDGEWLTPAPVFSGSVGHTQLGLGDTFTEVAQFTKLTNETHNQTLLTTALGLPNYQLSAVNTLVVTAIDNIHTVGGVVVGDVTLTGTTSVYETKDTSVTGNAIDFTTQSQSTLQSDASAGTNILNTATTAYAQNVPLVFAQYPNSIAHAITFNIGLDETTNPGNVPFVPLGEFAVTAAGPVPFDFAGTTASFKNTGANSSNVQFITNTLIAFQEVPEPGTCLIWAGLGGFGLLVRRVRRSKATA